MKNKNQPRHEPATQETTHKKEMKGAPKKQQSTEAEKALDGRKSKGMPVDLKAAMKEMPGELAAKFVQFYRLLLEGERSLIEHHHEVGSLVRELTDERKYGAGVVDRFARLCDFDASTLYRWQKVARCWTATDLKKTIRRTTAHGRTLAWSHLEKIAEYLESDRNDGHSREELVRRTLDERWTVAQLSDFLSGARQAQTYPSLSEAALGAAHLEHEQVATSEPDDHDTGEREWWDENESVNGASLSAPSSNNERLFESECRSIRAAVAAFSLQKRRWLANLSPITRIDRSNDEPLRRLEESVQDVEQLKAEVEELLIGLREFQRELAPRDSSQEISGHTTLPPESGTAS